MSRLIQQINQLLDGGVDTQLVCQKHEQLLTYYASQLSGVLRYMFNGYVVPVEIQDASIYLRRHMHDIQAGGSYITNSKKEITIHEQHASQNQLEHSFVFSGDDSIKHQIQFTLLEDSTWGVHPVTEIKYNERSYRSVSMNGDVLNHLHHQHKRYNPSYLQPLLDAGLISNNDIAVIDLFHQIHDLPEITKGDKHVNDKSSSDSDEEATIIQKLMVLSGGYSEQERTLIGQLFQLFEHTGNYFKGGERLMYILDALSSHDHPTNYFHQRSSLVGSILANQLPLFTTETATVDITSLTGKTTSIPLQQLPSAKLFFQQQKGRINEILESGEYNTIVPLREQIMNVYQL